MLPYTTIKMVKENLANVRKRIEQAAARAGKDPRTVRLVVVSKEATVEQVRQAVEAGVNDIGENRVKDALLKKMVLDLHVLTWHMIGHLQTNKARDAVKIFSIIHSVHSVKLAYILNQEAKKQGKVQDILIETNVSGEKSKFGVKPGEIAQFLEEAHGLKNVNILGLMTMAPFTENAESARPFFRKLSELAGAHGLKELSMGMTQDFEVAVEEGATMVRVGSAIFKR